MGTIKDIADPISSEHENPSIEFRIDIERATLKATTYAAVTFHVIEGPLQDSIHEQTILDRQSVRIQLGIYLRIVVTERAVLYQDIRGIEHIDRTGGLIPTVMIEFKAINLRVIPADDQALPDGLSTRRTPTKGFRFAFYISSSFPKLTWRNPTRRSSQESDLRGLNLPSEFAVKMTTSALVKMITSFSGPNQ